MNQTDMPASLMMDLAVSHVEALRVGWNAQQVKIDAILAAYDMVKDDPNARIPSALMAALEAAR